LGIEAQGVSQDRYTVIPRVLIFPFASDGKVLLLKGAAHKRIWAGLWNGIGGHVETGESILQAAQRELREETGLLAERLLFCESVFPPSLTHKKAASPLTTRFLLAALAEQLEECSLRLPHDRQSHSISQPKCVYVLHLSAVGLYHR